MILVLDNRDSFVFNLDQGFRTLGFETKVVRSDRRTAGELLSMRPRALVLSPGPGRPEEAGCLLALVSRAPPDLPILGVCLGHQALAQAEGAEIVQAKEIYHGRCSRIHHEGKGLFEGIESPIEGCRYHSLVVKGLPSCFVVDAWAENVPEVPMSIRHRTLPRYGLQFHPESFRTPLGPRLLANFLEIVSRGEPC